MKQAATAIAELLRLMTLYSTIPLAKSLKKKIERYRKANGLQQ